MKARRRRRPPELAEAGSFVSTQEVDRLAHHFGAPTAVVEHQLRNQLHLTVAF
jgi:hypothetical protein